MDYLPSTRLWYKTAINAADQTGTATDQRTWTDAYSSFSSNQLQVAHSVAVRNAERELTGVLTLKVSFKLLSELLGSLQISSNAIAFIIDRNGNLVATSNGKELIGAPDVPLLSASKSGSLLVRAAMANLPQSMELNRGSIYRKEENSSGKKNTNATCLESGRCENFQFELEGQTVLAHASALNNLPQNERSLTYPVLSKLAMGENFPDWRLVIAVPADDFNYVIKEKSQHTVLLAALFALLASAFGIWFALRLNNIIAAIARAAVKLGHGNLEHSPIVTRFAEFRQISDELENTADVLRASRDALVAQNAELEERVLARTQDLAYQTEQALLAVKAKAAFLATMSHEIRTPMNGVIGMTDLLARTTLNAEQRDYVTTIRASGDALLTIINDILDFSKIESGKLSLEREPLSLLQLIEESLALVAAVANRKNVELLYEIDPAVPAMVMGDVTRLRQIVLNLLSNAVKFTYKGEVHVHVQLENPLRPEILCITVRDTGIGIPEDRVDMLFSAFSQIDAATTRKFGGTGLGLAISRRLAEIMQGSIQVESELGQGSRFMVRVKAPPAVSKNEELLAMSAGQITSAILQALNGKHALLMDDNLSSLRVLKQRLASYGMTCVTISNLSGLNEVIANGAVFDCALIDFDMPDVNGISVAQHLHLKKNSANLPVILMSNVAESRELDAEHSCQVHLHKPIKESLLVDALLAVLQAEDKSIQFLRQENSQAKNRLTARQHAQQYPLRMLVVDDNATNRKVAHMMLQHFGYAADSASDGREAVDLVVAANAALRPFDLIWMDVHMPNLDGLESTKILRQSSIHPPYIVAMTAAAMHGDREMCLQAGMDDYVSKPLEVAGLERALVAYFKQLGLDFNVPLQREPDVVRNPQASQTATVIQSDLQAILATQVSELEPIQYFDPDRFMAFCEGNPSYRATFLVLIKNMIDKSPGQYATALQAWKTQKNEEAADVFHSMRGSLGTLGAIEFIEISGKLEEAIKRGEFETADALFVEIKEVLDQTLFQAQQWIDQQALA